MCWRTIQQVNLSIALVRKKQTIATSTKCRVSNLVGKGRQEVRYLNTCEEPPPPPSPQNFIFFVSASKVGSTPKDLLGSMRGRGGGGGNSSSV